MNITYAPFDPADYLDSDEVITAYLVAARGDPDPNIFLAALGDVEKALDTMKLTKQSTMRN